MYKWHKIALHVTFCTHLLFQVFFLFFSLSLWTNRTEVDTSQDQSKWPLKPGVLVRVGKMNKVSISQLDNRTSPFKDKTKSYNLNTYLKYRRNKSKVYARLRKLRDFLSGREGNERPFGIKEGANGGKKLLILALFLTFTVINKFVLLHVSCDF